MIKKILCAVLTLVAVIMVTGTASADPAGPTQPNVVIPPVFCFRITDIGRVPGDTTGNSFNFEFEVLNWTNQPATSVALASNVGTSNTGGVPTVTIGGASIDPNGRSLGAAFDPVAIQSGRGRGDIPGLLNNWTATGSTATTANWNTAGTGTPIPNRNLLGAPTTAAAVALIPGLGTDALGDLATDGGPGPYSPAAPPAGGGPPAPGTGNVLDGFVLTVNGFDVGKTLSFNWFLDNNGVPIGTAGQGNAWGFGVVNLARIPVGGALPGALFVGNAGFAQGQNLFFDNVFRVPNPAEFGAEFGVGITAPFLNSSDNIFGAGVNTRLIPEPSSLLLLISGGLVLGWRMRRRTMLR